jgi:hypothetical protein
VPPCLVEERHAQARELVVELLRQAPDTEVARAIDQLPAGDLQRLARLLTQATDPAEVARRITADPTTPSRPRRHPDRPQ